MLVRFILVFACLTVLLLGLEPALSWSNGGYSDNPGNPDYGTHDWIAQHALDYLPTQEKQYITDNSAIYLLGTELPDNSNKTIGGIGDSTKHHIYYNPAGTIIDDAAAVRARDTYSQALTSLRSNDYASAAKNAGMLTHYIADLAVFGHMMGASTAWGAEEHHGDYEDYVDTRTNIYSDTFNKYLAYDGNLSITTAYTAAAVLAYDSTFGGSNHLNCTWMDRNYNWSNQVFSDRCGESLNLAVNAVADVLHSLYVESVPPVSPTPSPSPSPPTPTATPTPTPPATATPTPSPTPSPIPTPSATPTPTPSPTTSPNPTATPAPTASPTAQPSTTQSPTTKPTATPKPTSTPTTTPQPTPTAPEFPAAALLLAAVLALTAIAMLCRKKPKSSL